MTTQERLNQTIYFVRDGQIEEDIFKSVIEDFFRDETTSPRGVCPRVHTRYNEETEKYEVWTWGTLGRFPALLNEFETEDEADNEVWEIWLYNYDSDNGSGLSDCDIFFFDEDEAKEWMAESNESLSTW
jgi:hypothetical protein